MDELTVEDIRKVHGWDSCQTCGYVGGLDMMTKGAARMIHDREAMVDEQVERIRPRRMRKWRIGEWVYLTGGRCGTVVGVGVDYFDVLLKPEESWPR